MKRIIAGIIVTYIFSALATSLLALAAHGESTGKIVGVVKLTGKAPAPKTIKVTKDKESCGHEKKSEDLITGKDGLLRNAVVSIADIQTDKKFDRAGVVDQRGCWFSPHVILVPQGSKLKVINSDKVSHNVKAAKSKYYSFNHMQPPTKREMEVGPFNKTDQVTLECNIHGWMRAKAVVADHAYYTLTDERGSFELSQVPPGTYTLQAWHEVLGKSTQKVTVKPGEQVQVTFAFGANAKTTASKK